MLRNDNGELIHDYKCDGCGQICNPVGREMGFHYAGTHCTNGNPGFHSDKRMVSDCCEEEFSEVEYDENDEPILND